MSDKKNNRDKWLHVRLNSDEFKRLHKQFESTTASKRSEYIRKIILGKPHIGKSRNLSIDEVITELGKLRMELKAAGNNLNQAVKKLHSVKHIIEIEPWLLTWELDKKKFYSTLSGITASLDKLSDQWFQ